MKVSIPERGAVEVDQDTWKSISTDEGFWKLVDEGKLAVASLSGGRKVFTGSCFVGQVLLESGILLEFSEKVPGSLQALAAHAESDSYRIRNYQSRASDLGEKIDHIVRQFLHSVKLYAENGRASQYQRSPKVGSIVCGKLQLAKTIALRARGLSHQVAFLKPELSSKTQLNKILYSAIREIEKLSRAVPLSEGNLAAARGLAILFSDCRDGSVLFGDRKSIIDSAIRYQKFGNLSVSHLKLIELAVSLLRHESFEFKRNLESSVQKTWFLNLENLFETATRRCFANAGRDTFFVRAGRESPPPIFSNETERYRANPDFVFYSCLDPDQVAIIGDAKYKNWTGAASQPDLYELLCHASAFEANTAFLIFPAEKFETIDLGVSASGIRVFVFTVNLNNFETEIQQFCGYLSQQIANITKN